MSFEGLTTIGQISIPVQDIGAAVEFYRDSLGMEFLFQVPNMAFFDCGGIRILLTIPEDGDSDQHSSIIYFKVADISASTDALRDRGVVITSDPHLIAEMPNHDLWMSFFQDQDENTLALMSEEARPESTEQSV
jgi:methylmalonyl-CoA/ethylmalonyl-CoA epimerase